MERWGKIKNLELINMETPKQGDPLARLRTTRSINSGQARSYRCVRRAIDEAVAMSRSSQGCEADDGCVIDMVGVVG